MNAILHTTQDDQGMMTVRIDVPGKPVNTITPAFLDELEATLDTIERSSAPPRAVIFASGKAGMFIAGADLYAVRDMDATAVAHFIERGQRLFSRVADLTMPTVAAINGTCLGGGLELALACDYRVAADDGSITIGLPEIRLGLLPGWGGTTRLPRLIGLRRALPLLLAGKTLSPRKARDTGMIDQVVRPDALEAAARRMAHQQPPRARPSRVDRCIVALRLPARYVLHVAHRRTLAKTHGHYPAADQLIETVRIGVAHGVEAGLRAERDHLLALTEGDVCRNLMRLFFLRQDARHSQHASLHAKPSPVARAAVIGGGTMGAGIVHALVRSGVEVRLIDIDHDAVAAGLRRISAMIDEDRRSRRVSPLEARQILRRVSPTTDWTGLGHVDLVVEAVPEDVNLKRSVFEKLDALTPDETVLATNTSSIEVTALAEMTRRPQRVIGLHFFNPVPKMPLVEVIGTKHSAAAALATAVELVNRLGKTPVLLHDAPGFLVNRLLLPYLAEAMTLATEGASIVQVDKQLRQWGMPMGPFELLDQVGLDVAAGIFRSVRDRLPGHGDACGQWFERMVERGWLGRKTGCGFYIHRRARWPHWRQPVPAANQPLLERLRGSAGTATAAHGDDLAMRLMLPMVNEMARLLAEDVVPGDEPTRTIDLATVLGLGWAPFRGGLAHWAQQAGLASLVKRMRNLEQRHGPRFAPCAPLQRIVDTGCGLDAIAAAHRGTAAPASSDVTAATDRQPANT